jgi:hypothetical protein
MNKSYAVIFTLLVFLSGCVATPEPLSEKNSDLTQGNVQMNLIVGQTSKADVLENFGSPNVTTRDGAGREVWSYQRAAQITQSSKQSGYWTTYRLKCRAAVIWARMTLSVTAIITIVWNR